ncbi:MAG: hypothetical protein EXQ91_05110 [Alphaproteobacteria bacterium]|nr:hypothetical protein [Alphaproteobacteria bacterium]
MTPEAFVLTSLLLGFFVLAGGVYASLASIATITLRSGAARLGHFCYALTVVVAAALVFATPLAIEWKVLTVVLAVAPWYLPNAALAIIAQIHGEALQPEKPKL